LSGDSVPGLPGASAALERICAGVAAQWAGVGVSVSIVSGHGHDGTAYATGPLAARIDELQFTLGEGPAFDAVRDLGPVLLTDLDQDGCPHLGRWPAFRAAALAEGVVTLLVFPLHVGVEAFGALTLHALTPVDLTESGVARVLRAAEAAARTLLDMIEGTGDPGDRLDDGDAYRPQVYQASGVLMEQLRVTTGEALARLRAHAFAHDQDITVVAKDILGHRLWLTRDSG
jgi:ANTAR domain